MQSSLEQLALECSLETTFEMCKDEDKEKKENPKHWACCTQDKQGKFSI